MNGLATRIVLTLVAVGTTSGLARSADPMLHSPAISAGHITFVYADDLWIAGQDGSSPRRLTSHPGTERNPAFSPDGKSIAFTASYDGNEDVYLIPVTGGEPTRLTSHPGPDVVRGFTPEGDVLFTSARSSFTRRFGQFYTVGPKGGFPKELKIPSGDHGAISTDGKFLAYNPLPEPFRQWKNYRGGQVSRIWVAKLSDLSVTPVPQPESRSNDILPMWVGGTVYFVSDRDGEFNLYKHDPSTKSVEKLTSHTDFPIDDASAGAGKIIYEQAGHLFIYDAESKVGHPLKIEVASDFAETRPRFVSGLKYVRAAELSPTGKRIAIEYRGEIFTIPSKKGDPRQLTETPGVHERSPIWSPDGKSLAYFSDATGEYALVVRPQDGKGDGKSYTLKGAGFYERPSWSPDSKKISYIDNSRTLYVIDLDLGKVTKVASEALYSPINTMAHAWSPDSKWLAYTTTNKASFQSISLYQLAKEESFPVTDGLAEASEPAFDASGKYLYFLASTDAGPLKNWFDQSNSDMRSTETLYLAVLAKDTPSPLRKESDEESKEVAETKDVKKEGEPKKEVAAKDVVIDREGLSDRILALPVPTGDFANLVAGEAGFLYFLKREEGRAGRASNGPSSGSVQRFDLKKQEAETLAEGILGFNLSADRTHLLYRSAKGFGVVDTGKFKPGDGAISPETIQVKIDPRAEWAQILREAWRINRDYFYAKNMHGADWDAIYPKYAAFLPRMASRNDLSRVIQAMLSELSVGHSFQSEGDRLHDPKPVPASGLLGADFEVAEGRYRVKKVYGGVNWDRALRSPLTAPGVNIKAGEFILSIDGRDLTSNEEIFARFEGKAGKLVDLKVGPKADGTEARNVLVEPIESEASLRNRDWVESNLKYVHAKTNGKVAYVYVPNTADLGHAYFKRYFFPQADKSAIIVDERFNGGGQVADYYIDFLRRQPVSHWATRYGAEIRTPSAAIMGPKVMIIDETAGSGGDLLPWMFRKFKLGTLVGRPTWGGLVGILGFPVLMDGGSVTAPDLAIFTDEGWVVENVGVKPDVEVEQWPAEVAAGRDPQLDKAIEIVLKELEKNPAQQPPRPADPVRVRKAEK